MINSDKKWTLVFSKRAKQENPLILWCFLFWRKSFSVSQTITKSQANGKIRYFNLVLLLAKMTCTVVTDVLQDSSAQFSGKAAHKLCFQKQITNTLIFMYRRDLH